MKSFLVGMKMLVFLLLIVSSVSLAADWPQFQGPNRDGKAVDQGIAKSWPEKGPKELWSVPLGEGFAGPAIVGNEIYILDRVDSERDILRCLDLTTGKELWTYSNESPGEAGFNGSRGTPTVSEKYVYAIGLLGDMICVDRKSHQLVWKKNLLKDFGGKKNAWGVAQHPLLYKNMVIVAPQGPEAFVVALDQDTGKEVWRTGGIGGAAYTSPHIVNLGNTVQLITVAPAAEYPDDVGYGEDEEEEEEEEEEEGEEEEEESLPSIVAGISLENGNVLWTYKGWSCRIPIPHPVQLSDDRLLVTGGYGAGSVMLQVSNTNGVFAAKELFKLEQDDFGLQIHQPILYKDHLYANNNGNEHREGMICMTLDGKVLWRTSDDRNLPRFDRGNLLMADQLIVNLDGKKGELHLIEPSPKGYKELAQAKVLSGKMMWSPMAISDGKLLVRNQEEIKCLDLRNP
jgi:outer membrane protein assembly factor BamB